LVDTGWSGDLVGVANFLMASIPRIHLRYSPLPRYLNSDLHPERQSRVEVPSRLRRVIRVCSVDKLSCVLVPRAKHNRKSVLKF
jgi:hypothetical protein